MALTFDTRLSSELSATWAAKGRGRSRELLALAGDVARPAEVVTVMENDPASARLGNFMLAWLDKSAAPRRVHHLPDGAFFLSLLGGVYEPLFQENPGLRDALRDTSRLEISITNDVLQIQLDDLGPDYSMIRHHALMLFNAILWLDEPSRGRWLEISDASIRYLATRTEGAPQFGALRDIEAAAFADFVEFAPRTIGNAEQQDLLDDRSALRHVNEYQLCATAAIGLLWRQYCTLSGPDRSAWQRIQLTEGYLSLDYLEQDWNGIQ